MRKLFIILCMFSCYSLCIAQDIKYDSIQKSIIIRIGEDRIIRNPIVRLNLNRIIKDSITVDQILNTGQDDIGINAPNDIVSVKRYQENKIIELKFNTNKSDSIIKKKLSDGITLKTAEDKYSQYRIIIEYITLLDITNRQAILLQELDSLGKKFDRLIEEITIGNNKSKLLSLEYLLPILANTIISIILSIIIVTLVYIRIGKKKEEITIKKEPHIEKGFESIKEMFNILRDEQNKGLNQIAQFRKKLEYIQQLQIDYINKKGEEEKSHKPASPLSDSTTDTNNSPTNPIPKTGYITTLNRTIYDKDILPTSNEFCIFEIMFLNEKEAKYFINTDPKALPNIVSSAFMLGDSCIDETKGKQATSVQTNEPGILRREGGHWTIIKPTKFTIK